MTAVAVRFFVKVRGKDEYRARTESERQVVAQRMAETVRRKALRKLGKSELKRLNEV